LTYPWDGRIGIGLERGGLRCSNVAVTMKARPWNRRSRSRSLEVQWLIHTIRTFYVLAIGDVDIPTKASICFATTFTNRYKSQVRKAIRSWTPRKSLEAGTVLILLAGRFRGKRVILLKTLEQGVLLVTGPFKINGVPLRRVNSRYVIATSYKVDVSGLDEKKVEEISQPKYFTAEKAKEKAGEEAFFKQGEKPEV
jgi:ribosomal protein L14E/L6E/L27E